LEDAINSGDTAKLSLTGGGQIANSPITLGGEAELELTGVGGPRVIYFKVQLL
jgi:hypothetical protein